MTTGSPIRIEGQASVICPALSIPVRYILGPFPTVSIHIAAVTRRAKVAGVIGPSSRERSNVLNLPLLPQATIEHFQTVKALAMRYGEDRCSLWFCKSNALDTSVALLPEIDFDETLQSGFGRRVMSLARAPSCGLRLCTGQAIMTALATNGATLCLFGGGDILKLLFGRCSLSLIFPPGRTCPVVVAWL